MMYLNLICCNHDAMISVIRIRDFLHHKRFMKSQLVRVVKELILDSMDKDNYG